MLKLIENPPLRYPEEVRLREFTGTWWVAHTKARCEKAFAWDLLKGQTPYFLPMVERVTFSGGRKRHVLSPLFSSYVFFCGGEQARYEALVTDRLCQVIPVKDQATLIRELSSIEKALEGRIVLDPYPFAVVGSRCRVARGPFQGLEGTVVERTTLARLVLQIGLLGQAVSLQIDTDLLEPAE